jgi:hypothetical protein
VSFTKPNARKAMLQIPAKIKIFYIFLLIWIKFGMRDISKNVFSKYEFHDNWSSESHKLPRGVHKFLSAIAHLLSPWDKSRHRRSAHNNVEDLQVS